MKNIRRLGSQQEQFLNEKKLLGVLNATERLSRIKPERCPLDFQIERH